MRIDRDTFEEWTAHPITEALFRVCDAGVQKAVDDWTRMSIEGGSCDPIMLARVRERIAVLREIRDITAETIEEVTNG